MKITQAFREKELRNIQVLNGGIKQKSDPAPMHPGLYELDEGDIISFAKGTHGVLILDGVGHGKTASFMLPMASSLLEQGLPGLIIDVKNNFPDQVRKLAQTAERENNIIEIGTHPTANPLTC